MHRKKWGRLNRNIPWESIIRELAPELDEAINKKPCHVPCPIHGGNDGLRCFDDFDETGGMICNTCGSFPNGYLVLAWFLSLPTHLIAKIINQTISAGDRPAMDNIIHLPSTMSTPLINEQAQYQIRGIMAECLPLTHPDAVTSKIYFYNRGIIAENSTRRALGVDNLFYHPGLSYPNCSQTAHPALVASIRRDGEIVGLHKTYLTEDGYKARGKDSKRIGPVIYKGATTGGAVALQPANEEMAVAEGIESSLAVYEESGMAVWAATSAHGMAMMEIPGFVKKVVIFADNDQNGVGQQAAERLAYRLRRLGKKARVFAPERPRGNISKSFDILDHFIAGRLNGMH